MFSESNFDHFCRSHWVEAAQKWSNIAHMLFYRHLFTHETHQDSLKALLVISFTAKPMFEISLSVLLALNYIKSFKLYSKSLPSASQNHQFYNIHALFTPIIVYEELSLERKVGTCLEVVRASNQITICTFDN